MNKQLNHFEDKKPCLRVSILSVLLCIFLSGCEVYNLPDYDCTGIENLEDKLASCIKATGDDYSPRVVSSCKEAIKELSCKPIDNRRK